MTTLSPFLLDMVAFQRAHRRILALVAEQHGLSVTQISALFRLWTPGPCTMSELSSHLHLTTGGVTSVVDALAAADLCTRRTKEGDRRVCLAELTPRGHELVAVLGHASERHYQEWIALLPEPTRSQVHAVFHDLARAAPQLTVCQAAAKA